MSAERQQAHELIERLRPEQVSAVVSLLQFMLLDPVARHRHRARRRRAGD